MQRYIAGSAPGTPCTISCCPRLSRTQRNQYNAAAALAWTTRRRTESIQSLLATIVLFLAFTSVPPIWQPTFDAYLPPVPDHSSSFAAARVPSLDIDWYVQAPELRVASCREPRYEAQILSTQTCWRRTDSSNWKVPVKILQNKISFQVPTCGATFWLWQFEMLG